MKSFLLHFFKFFGILIVISLCTFKAIDYLNLIRFEKYINSLHQEAIFVGDSHIQNGINDAVITNGVNLSQSGEPYYFTYYKIKKIVALKKNKIKTIYLGFGYHNLSTYHDDCIFGKSNQDISARYFFIIPTSEKARYIGFNKNNIPIYFKKIVDNGLVNITRKKEKFSFLGYYQNGFVSMASQKSSMDKRLKRQFYSDTAVADFSKVNIEYLNKIISFCLNNKIKLVVLNTPLDPYYKSKIPQEYLDKYNQIVDSNKLEVIDFHNLKFQKEDFLKDGDHVSTDGALKISKFLNNSF